ncbi:MAG: indole-3-glycerol phosphate synthase TrpC [Cyclobacteriaceae bacterium]
MSILATILEHKRTEVDAARRLKPLALLTEESLYHRPTLSMSRAVSDPSKSGIIAEFKRKSPSRGIINDRVDVKLTTAGYVAAGASALSVLTDAHFFGGSAADLLAARSNTIPIIRKDFTVDAYQVHEARALGADAILLIAAALEPQVIQDLTALAHSLHLEVLLEVHNEAELAANVHAAADLIGVNNRDLRTFGLSIQNSLRLAPLIPTDVVRVSESGIESVEAFRTLRAAGYKGFLIGQYFMQEPEPPVAASQFIQKLRSEGVLP